MQDRTPSPLIEMLSKPACYPHPATNVERLETHISWLLLAGDFAYKIKKPVDLGFLDFTTLEKRRHFCEEELRLNRRLAPALYLDVVPISGSEQEPRIGGTGRVIEYALKMRRFPQDALASRLLASGRLTPQLVETLALRIAQFHASLPHAAASEPYGEPQSILHNALQNFEQLESMSLSANESRELRSLRDWTEREFVLQHAAMRERRAAGMVRECHGDLHLGNLVLLGGELVPFDCLEFNPELRWSDVMSDVAFLMMDLLERGAARLAWLFLNAYLEATGVYSSLAVLRFYLVYRALVRAKVHLMRAHQCGGAREAASLIEQYRSYVRLAQRCASLQQPAMLLMHGFSGSGKSTIARELAQSAGAIWIRSDIERKRLHGMMALARTDSAVGAQLYSDSSTAETYDRLADAARVVVRNGFTAIVDASFLRRAQRGQMREVAAETGVPIAVIDIHAPASTLRARIATRSARGTDPSEATPAVLEYQEGTAEPVTDEEGLYVIPFDGSEWLTRSSAAGLVRFLTQRATAVEPAAPGEELSSAGDHLSWQQQTQRVDSDQRHVVQRVR